MVKECTGYKMTLTPDDRIQVQTLKGDIRQGGWVASCLIEGDTNAVTFGEYAPLFGRSFAGFADSEMRQYLAGHVIETPSFDFSTLRSASPFRIGTANYLLTGRHQTVGHAEIAPQANNHQHAPGTFRLSTGWLESLTNHCNFLYDATERPDGIIFSTDIDTTDVLSERFNIRESNDFWTVLQNQWSGGEEGGVQFFRTYCRRNNTIVYQPAPQFRTPTPTSKGTLTTAHMRDQVRVTVRNANATERVGQVQLTIVNTGDVNAPFTAQYPATEPTVGDILKKGRNIVADSQARADSHAENLYRWLTRPYTVQVAVDPGLVLFGDDGAGLDLGDAIAITYDGMAENTATGAGVHIQWSEQLFYIYGVVIRFSPDRFNASCILTLEADNS